MKSPALRQFLQAVAADPALQAQIGAAADLGQLVQRAQAAGFAITARELQLWAHDEAFTAPWWPWAEGGRAERTAFFSGQQQ
jgi:predicted ribosomally synthesized peptide with nif11-like leader